MKKSLRHLQLSLNLEGPTSPTPKSHSLEEFYFRLGHRIPYVHSSSPTETTAVVENRTWPDCVKNTIDEMYCRKKYKRRLLL